MSDRDYEARELQLWHRQIRDAERAPLAERKAGMADHYDRMAHHPEMVAERADWLLAGNYGHGPMVAAKRVLAGRGNKEAAITQMLGVLEHNCPPHMTVQAWKKLTFEQKLSLNKALRDVFKAERE